MVEQKGVSIFLIVVLVLGLALLGYGIYSMITLKTMTKACENDKDCNFMKNMNAYGSLAIGLLLVLFAGGFYYFENKDSNKIRGDLSTEQAFGWGLLIVIGLAIFGFGIYALVSKSKNCKTNKECKTITDRIGYGAAAVGAVITLISAVFIVKTINQPKINTDDQYASDDYTTSSLGQHAVDSSLWE